MTEPEDVERQHETWEQKAARHSVSAESKYQQLMDKVAKTRRSWDVQHPAWRWAFSILFVALIAVVVAFSML